MKNALILHGTDAEPNHNWFPSLKELLESNGYKVWVPQLPDAHRPNSKKYNDYLLNSDWGFNDNSLIVGHSSGAVEVLALLEALPENVSVDTAVLVGSFRGDLGWDKLSELVQHTLDLEKIKTRARRFVIIHSDNDPYCPLEDAKYYAEELDGELVVVPNAQHFTPKLGGDEYKKGSFVIDALKLEEF